MALILLLLLAAVASAAEVVVVHVDGTIDGTYVSLVSLALRGAESRGVPLVVVLNTYGGMLVPMDKIVDMLLAARVPVYAYIPPGARRCPPGPLSPWPPT